MPSVGLFSLSCDQVFLCTFPAVLVRSNRAIEECHNHSAAAGVDEHSEAPRCQVDMKKRQGAFSSRRQLRSHPSTASAPEETFQIKAEWLNDGTALERIADRCMFIFKYEEESLKTWTGPGRLNISSMCSGCEFPLITSAQLNRVFAQEHSERMLQLHLIDSCDIDPKKQRFIKKLHHADINPDDHPPVQGGACLYNDAKELRNEKAWCCLHKRMCKVVCGDIVIIGFSCKDISRANPNHSKVNLSNAESPGGSCDTWHALLHRLDNAEFPPVLLIIENVDALTDDDDDGKSQFDLVVAELSNRGYECKAVKLDAVEFGMPQRRRRIYIVCIRLADRRLDWTRQGVEETFEMWEQQLKKLRMNPCDLEEVLLPDDHEWIQQSLTSAIARMRGDPEHTWLDLHMSFYKDKKLPWGGVKAPESTRSSLWWSAVPARDQDIIAVLCALHSPAKRPALADTSQNIFITPLSSKRLDHDQREITVSPTALPGAKWWHFKNKRYCTGEEKMCLQAFPTRNPKYKGLLDDTDDSVRHKLGGDSFTGSVILVVKWTLIRVCPWVQRQEVRCSDHDVETAFRVLKARRR